MFSQNLLSGYQLAAIFTLGYTMAIRARLRKLLEPIVGTPELPPPPPEPPPPPHGVDLIADIKTRLQNYCVSVIFDVGANVGSSAQQYLNGFPEATIYCFEPVAATYQQLQTNVGSAARVRCFQQAIGATAGAGTMVLQGTSDIFYLAEATQRQAKHADAPRETVELETIDRVCAAQGIERINLLKIDTEGADLDVLAGAQRMVAEQRIDLVEVEAGMNPGNTWHVPLERFKTYFEARGYFLFGFYDQFYEWPTDEPHLRRANAVFIATHVIKASKA